MLSEDILAAGAATILGSGLAASEHGDLQFLSVLFEQGAFKKQGVPRRVGGGIPCRLR